MKRLNRLQALLLIFGLPTILRLVTWPFDNLIVFTLVTFLFYGLLSLWYFDVLKTIKNKVKIDTSQELIIKSFLVYLLIYPVVATTAIMFKKSPTEIPLILKFGNLSFAVFGLTALYLLAINFDKFLATQNEKTDKVMTFILLAVYPIGIWKYHDKLKTDKEVSEQQ